MRKQYFFSNSYQKTLPRQTRMNIAAGDIERCTVCFDGNESVR